MTTSRRDFLHASASCAAHLGLMSAGLSLAARRSWAQPLSGRIVAEEPWGRLERLSEGVWALVSTPLTGDRTTLCNGGIIAGRNGVAMIEAFASDQGAQWMAEQARALTGRAPTHVILTHYHADHSGGIRGAIAAPGCRLHTTAVTRDLTGERNRGAPTDLLRDAQVMAADTDTLLDLGGRSLRVTPLDGHTPSDVSVRVEGEAVLFCGDLVWNGMFPNYVDAIPSRLSRGVRALRASGATTFVSGHGSVANLAQMDAYLKLLDSVEAAARRAIERGASAEAAGAEYRIPDGLGEWHLFNPRYYERAIGAWMRELSAGSDSAPRSPLASP